MVERLVGVLPGERLLPPEDWAVQGVVPAAAVAPATVDEAAAVLQLATSEGWAVEAAGAGTWLRWGRPPRRLDVVLSTRSMAGAPDHQPDDLTVSVDAGVTLDALQATLVRRGQWLPLDPPGGGPGTVGALVAGAGAGPLRAGYGTPRDHVLGLELLAGDGRRLRFGGRVVKNVAGYDATRLMVGSRGTLGVITRVHMRLHPLPERDLTLAAASDEVEPVLAAAAAIRAERLEPVALELVAPALSARAGLPEGWTLLARFHGNEDAVSAAAEAATAAAAGSARAEPLDGAAVREALGAAEATAPLVVRLADRPSRLGRTLERATELAGGTPVAVHAAAGIVRLLVDAADTPDLAGRVAAVRAAMEHDGGTLSLATAPAELAASVDPHGVVGPSIRLMRGLARVFDPAGVLGPGRFVLDEQEAVA